MNVHLFKVVPIEPALALEVLLARINGDVLAARVRDIHNSNIRLENIRPPRTENNASSFWLLDFTKLRFEHGPGKVGMATAIEGFVLNADEGFGEETSALFDPVSNYILVQYNHHGVRSTAIQEYFNLYDHHANGIQGYNLRVKLDESAELRLAQKEFITKLHFKVDAAQITAAQRNANVGLGRALELNDSYGGQNIEIVISAGRNDHLRFADANRLIDRLKRLVGIQEEEFAPRIVSKFEVTGKNHILDRGDAINMLAPKLELTIDQLVLGPDRRYTVESRFGGLLRAHRGFRDAMRN